VAKARVLREPGGPGGDDKPVAAREMRRQAAVDQRVHTHLGTARGRLDRLLGGGLGRGTGAGLYRARCLGARFGGLVLAAAASDGPKGEDGGEDRRMTTGHRIPDVVGIAEMGLGPV